nr:GTPase [Candidatus Sigynarchaeota archaeon]
ICSSNIEVAQYPFTTKEIKVGHYKNGIEHIQFVDTPGVLDRPMGRRNTIELQAITAMEHIAKIILFVMDPTVNCGYSLDDQVNLFKEVHARFPNARTVVVLNKLDVMTGDERDKAEKSINECGQFDIVIYSAFTRANEEALITTIKHNIKTLETVE